MKNQILYIYLARRDKTSIKTLASFSTNEKFYPTKLDLDNLNKYQISQDIIQSIKKEISKNKLIYEVYIESAESMIEFRNSLIARGYKNIPLQQINFRIRGKDTINENLLVTKKNTMIRSFENQSKTT